MDSAALRIPDHRHILGMRVDGTSYADAVDRVLAWGGAAAPRGVPVGFVGGAPAVLERLTAAAAARFPGLNVAFAESPPFRPLTDEEDQGYVERINRSGARILFVGLGCPKQEWWMAARRRRVRAVMLGVGAAFDFLAGTKPWAPRWMRQAGLEWLFRLATEPKRLWRRDLRPQPRL